MLTRLQGKKNPVSYLCQYFQISTQPDGAGRVNLYSWESEAEFGVPEAG